MQITTTASLLNAEHSRQQHSAGEHLQLAHFLEADLQPWSAVLAGALFPAAALPAALELPDQQPEACAARAEGVPASRTLANWNSAWQRLEALSPPSDVISAVARASPLPLRKQLLLTPAEWQPAVIGSRAANGALSLDSATATACRGAMHTLHAVHSLSLYMSPSGSRPADAVAAAREHVLTLHAVATMPALRSLRFGTSLSWDLLEQFVDMFAHPLSRLSHLVSLRLSHVWLSTAVLAEIFGTLTALTCLHMDDPPYSTDDTESLSPALSRLPRSLAHLRLQERRFDAAAVAQRLADLTALTALDLGRNNMSDVGAEALAPALSRLSQLARLLLPSNSIGAAGAAALQRPLDDLATLTALDLSSNEMGDAGAEALAPALSRLSLLADLRLSSDRLSAAGAAALLQPLADLARLTALDLSYNEVDAAAVVALVPALSRLSRLAHLALKRNHVHVGAAGAAALARPLSAPVSYTHLTLPTTPYV